LQYKDAELGSRVTLVGPHRDDLIFMFKKNKEDRELKYFGSRGQQRLAILELRLLQLLYMENALGERPLLLLDDIFSELDSQHINLVLTIAPLQQTIITTTHEEFVGKNKLKDMEVIKLDDE
jgi:DNA replication and repair protein RecF